MERLIVSDWMTVMSCEGHDQKQDSWQGRDKIIIIKHKHLGGSRHFITLSRNTLPLSSVPLNEIWYWWLPAPGQEGEPGPEPGGGVCWTSILPPFMIQHKAMKKTLPLTNSKSSLATSFPPPLSPRLLHELPPGGICKTCWRSFRKWQQLH